MTIAELKDITPRVKALIAEGCTTQEAIRIVCQQDKRKYTELQKVTTERDLDALLQRLAQYGR